MSSSRRSFLVGGRGRGRQAGRLEADVIWDRSGRHDEPAVLPIAAKSRVSARASKRSSPGAPPGGVVGFPRSSPWPGAVAATSSTPNCLTATAWSSSGTLPSRCGHAGLRSSCPRTRALRALPEHRATAGTPEHVGVPPGRPPAILVGAHYDTEWHPMWLRRRERAAGTAAVMELPARSRPNCPRITARSASSSSSTARRTRPAAATGTSSSARSAARGRTRLPTRGRSGHDSARLHRELSARIAREANSNQAFEQLRQAAAEVGAADIFPAGVQGGVIDDHIPFLEQAILSIDLIDFSAILRGHRPGHRRQARPGGPRQGRRDGRPARHQPQRPRLVVLAEAAAGLALRTCPHPPGRTKPARRGR